ncbi:hypothetical protein [Luethyella okanaganae]|uniref:Uncharacterized protein n=1 Tax=Luethyella okanaganae TaxID=69372 RepID=A0ABW1VH57_9MICO
MSYEEKGTWVYLVVSVGAYAVYLALVLTQAATMPIAEAPYITPLLWTIGIAIAASIVGRIVIEIVKPSEGRTSDARDRGIGRSGLYAGLWFVVGGAVVALGLAMVEADYFWIANVIYLAFVLSAILQSVVKILSYHRGYTSW